MSLQKHITLKKNSKDEKNNLKFSRFFLMLRIYSWRIENQSVTELSRKLCSLPCNNYVVSKFLLFSLNKFKSGSHELSSDISSLPSNKLHFKNSKFWGLYEILFCLFRFILYLGTSRKTKKPNDKIIYYLSSNSHCCFTKVFIDENTRILYIFWILKIFFLPLNLSNLQTIVLCLDWFLINLPVRWQRLNSISAVIPNLFSTISWTFFSQVSITWSIF